MLAPSLKASLLICLISDLEHLYYSAVAQSTPVLYMRSFSGLTNLRSAILPGMAKRPKQTKQKNPAAVALGRLGGLRSGRWKNIPAEQRGEAMRKAAQA